MNKKSDYDYTKPKMVAKRQWYVRNRDDWDIMYQQVIAYYWNLVGLGKIDIADVKKMTTSQQVVLLNNMLIDIGVGNIELFPSQSGKQLCYDGILIYGKENSGLHGKHEHLLKLIPSFFKQNDDTGVVQWEYQSEPGKNGWVGLHLGLTIKLPNRCLVGEHVKNLLEHIDYKMLNEVCRDWLSESFPIKGSGCFFEKEKQTKEDAQNSVLLSEEGFSYFDVDISKILTLIATLDRLLQQLETYAKHVSIKDVHQDYDTASSLMETLEIELYEHLTALLSNFVSLGLYFPLGLGMAERADIKSMLSKFALQSNIRQAVETAFDNNDNLLKNINFEDVAVEFVKIFSKHSYAFKDWKETKKPVTEEEACKIVSQSMPEPSEQTTRDDILAESPGFRGGCKGIDGDYAWEYFLPRLVAHNWEKQRAPRSVNGGDTIKDDTMLRDYHQLLKDLGYKVPEFVNVKLKLVDELPFIFDGQEADWNYKDYIAEMTVAFPTPPKSKYKPIALVELIARRANQPFTTAPC